MKKMENENKDLMLGQKSLLEIVQKINKLFKIHFDSLSFFLISSICNSIFLIYSLITGQFVPTLAQRYGVFGIVINVLEVVVLIIMCIYFTFQISVYYSFVIKGNRSIKKIEENDSNIDSLQSNLHHGIVSYVNNVSTFFKRYSKDKTKLSDIVTIFLYMNFLFGFYIIFILYSLIGIGDTTFLTSPFSAILFLTMIISWLVSFGTSFKIRKNIITWEKIIPKLDTWAQELEDLPSNTSSKSEILEDEQKK